MFHELLNVQAQTCFFLRHPQLNNGNLPTILLKPDTWESFLKFAHLGTTTCSQPPSSIDSNSRYCIPSLFTALHLMTATLLSADVISHLDHYSCLPAGLCLHLSPCWSILHKDASVNLKMWVGSHDSPEYTLQCLPMITFRWKKNQLF